LGGWARQLEGCEGKLVQRRAGGRCSDEALFWWIVAFLFFRALALIPSLSYACHLLPQLTHLGFQEREREGECFYAPIPLGQATLQGGKTIFEG
jgi:hypothetical protein